MSVPRTVIGVFVALSLHALTVCAQPRPNLVISRPEADLMQAGRGAYPLFDRAVDDAVRMLDEALKRPLDVPVPVDAGGPTHERHKQNYLEMQTAGVIYAMTGEIRYAHFVRDMLKRYAALYPGLPPHPMAQSGAPGRLFWQTLNETVWLLHVAQAYDCVHDQLTAEDRNEIESKLLRPMVRFFTVDNERTFNRVHNHATWMVGAVGMLGYALRDRDLVEKALYGTRKDSTGGFFRQLDLLFSPDGYYTEGAYYTRYAVMPYFLFAQAIEHNQPELKIFAYRDSILHKVLHAAIQQTAPDGTFLPMNDALKEMSLAAKEAVAMVDIGYARYGGDRGLLSIAARQGRVMLSGSGLRVAQGLAAGPPPAYPFRSIELRDGPDGRQGGVGLLRGPAGNGTLLVMKYASQGMGHGHYDRLGLLYYDQGREVLQDYGSARFINVETKNGGRYLPENSSWAQQTIAHNTVAVDGRSQFDGKLERAEQFPGQRHFFEASDSFCQVMSATADQIAPGVRMQRTVFLVRDERFPSPPVIDVVRLTADAPHQYDLPFYYQGQLVDANPVPTARTRTRLPLGERNGYQHLWVEATASARGTVQWTWLAGGRYYSVISAADTGMEVSFVRIGAGDPGFNLRPDPAVILSRRASSCVFASVIEPHGVFDPVDEISRNARPAINEVRVVADTDDGTVVEVGAAGGFRWRVQIANGSPSATALHTVSQGGVRYAWKGNTALVRDVR